MIRRGGSSIAIRMTTAPDAKGQMGISARNHIFKPSRYSLHCDATVSEPALHDLAGPNVDVLPSVEPAAHSNSGDDRGLCMETDRTQAFLPLRANDLPHQTLRCLGCETGVTIGRPSGNPSRVSERPRFVSRPGRAELPNVEGNRPILVDNQASNTERVTRSQRTLSVGHEVPSGS